MKKSRNFPGKTVRMLAAVLLVAGVLHSAQARIPVRSWVDSVAVFGMEVFLPAEQFKWDWSQATMLNSVVHLYREATSGQRQVYLDYIKTAMDRTMDVANGRHPNAVSPAHGLAFLYGELNDSAYWKKAQEVWTQYLLIPRAPNYGVSHRAETVELWDDTIYMLGMYLFEMYRRSGDEKYLESFVEQYFAHAQVLGDKSTGLWVHGWDADDDNYDDRCSQRGWPDPATGRSAEIWGRGNGWVVMALGDALDVIPKSSPMWKQMAAELRKMTEHLHEWQDPETGLWYQLPVRFTETGNFLESSCSAMFAYGITLGLKHGVLNEKSFRPMVDKVYRGLRRHAMTGGPEPQYLVPTRVCLGTCVGDRDYYFQRKIGTGVHYGISSYVMFGLEYEKLYGLR